MIIKAESAVKNLFILELLRKVHLPVQDISDAIQFFYYEEDERIIACAGLETHGSCGLLRSVAVAPERKNKGLGKMMVTTIIDYAKQKKIKDLFLLTTTAPLFFEKLGFTCVERTNVPEAIKHSTEFSSICPNSAIVMRKKVNLQ